MAAASPFTRQELINYKGTDMRKCCAIILSEFYLFPRIFPVIPPILSFITSGKVNGIYTAHRVV